MSEFIGFIIIIALIGFAVAEPLFGIPLIILLTLGYGKEND